MKLQRMPVIVTTKEALDISVAGKNGFEEKTCEIYDPFAIL